MIGDQNRAFEKNCRSRKNFSSSSMLRPALDLVLSALEQIQERSDRAPCASRETLAQLFSTRVSPEELDSIDLLEPVRKRVEACLKCPHLARTRTQTVFGVGNPHAELMFVG